LTFSYEIYNDQGSSSLGIVIIIDSDFSKFFNSSSYLFVKPTYITKMICVVVFLLTFPVLSNSLLLEILKVIYLSLR
jgi:hypothetical protein